MKLTISECTAILNALNQQTKDLESGWGDCDQEEREKRIKINRRAYLKVQSRRTALYDLEKTRSPD